MTKVSKINERLTGKGEGHKMDADRPVEIVYRKDRSMKPCFILGLLALIATDWGCMHPT